MAAPERGQDCTPRPRSEQSLNSAGQERRGWGGNVPVLTWEESAVVHTSIRKALPPPPSASHALRLESAAHTDFLTGLRGCAGSPFVQEFRVDEEALGLALGTQLILPAEHRPHVKVRFA